MAEINLQSIDHGKPFDWGRTSENYAKYRDIYPTSFYAKLRELGIGLPGQHVLDLGTGTGVLPRNLGGARFHYMDRSRLMPKLHHVLKPGGLFAICSMIYLPHECEICRGSEVLVLKYSPNWTGANFTRQNELPAEPKWIAPMFHVKHRVLYCEDIPFTRESWHGRMLSCRGVEASLSSEDVMAFTKDHWAYMQTLPEEFTVKHQVMVFVLARM